MTRAQDLAKLETLAQLALDHRLTALRTAADDRSRSQMQIGALDRSAEPADLPPVAAGLVALRYRLWADQRRTELNTVLARQTADWLEARDAARLAFGRLDALRGVARRLADRR